LRFPATASSPSMATSESPRILLPGWAEPMNLDWPGDGWPFDMPQMALIGGPYLEFRDHWTPSAMWLRPGWAFLGDSANRWWWIPPSPPVWSGDYTPRFTSAIPTGTFDWDRGFGSRPGGGDPGPPIVPPEPPPHEELPEGPPPITPVDPPNVPEPGMLGLLVCAGLSLRRQQTPRFRDQTARAASSMS
jgi:hypothetical protein